MQKVAPGNSEYGQMSSMKTVFTEKKRTNLELLLRQYMVYYVFQVISR